MFILVGIFGPPDTLYEGGYFKADMEFPTTYPFAPPKVNKSHFSNYFQMKLNFSRLCFCKQSLIIHCLR